VTTIVMTGATSGLGKVAAERLVSAPNTTVLIGARRPGPPGTELYELDLTSLASVRRFAKSVAARVDGTGIDALVLNAGISLPSADQRSADGYEATFAVNHLAHYLLVDLLRPRLAQSARLIFTTSGTHDPAEGTVIPPPRHANAWLLAFPDRDSELDDKARAAGGRAYSSSKLCAVLTVRSLAADTELRERRVVPVAYDPGPTPGTGLLRATSPILRAVWSLLGTPVGRLMPRFSSKAAAGAALAALATGQTPVPDGETYAALRRGKLTWRLPSELARRDDLAEALWRDSAQLVALVDAQP
jgi:NAD(P)-dependent dehydrogenase (short-subunit alcohol dehydrogenase family)